MTIVLALVQTELSAGFARLRDEARSERHTNMERLAADRASGANCFDRTNDALLAAFATEEAGGELAGVAGMNIDLVRPDALRLRRFYVGLAFRRHGVGRCLAHALMAKARGVTSILILNAETELATRLWGALGFVADHRDGYSHVLRLPSAIMDNPTCL